MLDLMTKLVFKGQLCNHYSHEVLYTHLNFATLEAVFDIDYEVQRQLDVARRLEIRNFIISAITKGLPLYFSSLVFSARGQIQQQDDEFVLTPGSKLYLIDGQHRLTALSSAITHLKNELEALERLQQHDELQKVKSYIHSLNHYPITLQIYMNLTQKQERQLFSDTNSTSREAHSGLLLQYDQRDTYNQFTRKIAAKLEDKIDIELNASRLTSGSSSLTSLTTMKRCMLALFEGLTNEKKDASILPMDEQSMEEIALAFFESWLKLFPKQMTNRQKYACGLAGVQIALAHTTFLLTRNLNISYSEAIDQLLQLKKICTWQITDPLFDHMYNTEKKRLERNSSSTMIKRTNMRFYDALNVREG